MDAQKTVNQLRVLLAMAIETKNEDLIRQYTWGLFVAQGDLIKELQRKLTRQTLTERYRKVA